MLFALCVYVCVFVCIWFIRGGGVREEEGVGTGEERMAMHEHDGPICLPEKGNNNKAWEAFTSPMKKKTSIQP